jgi:hypothetical protein
MQNYLDKLNLFINDTINKVNKKKIISEGENLVTDFNFNNKASDSASDSNAIQIPTVDILSNEKSEIKKDEAKKHFIDEGRVIVQKRVEREKFIENIKDDSKHIFKGVSYFIFALIFIFLAFLVFKYADVFINRKVNTENKTFVIDNDLIRADNSRVISIESGAKLSAIRDTVLPVMQNEEVKLGLVTVVSPSYLRQSDINGKKVFVSEAMRGDEVFFIFAQSAPLSLRAISSDKYALGVTNVLGKNENFFAFSVTDKVTATKELFAYESAMYGDFKSVFRLREATGTITIKDISINNHELRAVMDGEGMLMVYGFAGAKAIIMAPNIDTFEKAFERLK